VTLLEIAAFTLAACSSSPAERKPKQTSFISAPPNGSAVGNQGGGPRAGLAAGAGAAVPAAGAAADAASAAPTRTVEETDLYRLEGNRLYFLNGYRGLMVFDVTDVDHPTLVGRSAIYGTPVDMIVRNGIATVVVADWYGQLDDGTPFHGSIVRGLDATDPTNIKVLGEAKLGGWVRDDRVVGDVIYAVSEDYGWSYGWDTGAGVSDNTETVIVSSVSFANKTVAAVGKVEFPGFSGIFNVTPTSILLAHDATIFPAGGAAAGTGGSASSGEKSAADVDGGADDALAVAVPDDAGGTPTGKDPPALSRTKLLYLDISDPAGQIVQRGSIVVNGAAQGWGADNGRWNLDFSDGKTARVIGCLAMTFGYGYSYCGDNSSYVLSIADFSNADAPVLSAELDIANIGWGPAARFDSNRLYLSPSSNYYLGNGASQSTPFQVYDLTNSKAPVLAGTLTIPGNVWNILPAPGLRLFALGSDSSNTPGFYSSSVSLKYLDVTTPSSPKLLGTSTFGQGWAWTPAAGTFKAFTMDATQGLVVLPFSGWDSGTEQYSDGLQLIDFTASSIATGGAAHTRGWVERGIFVHNRLVSLSDLSLAVVDYTNHAAPVVTSELTLARNVITAQPQGSNIAEISSDWWDNDQSWSEVRLVPIANAEETTDSGNIPTLRVEGVNAQVFLNGSLAYVVTNVRVPAVCDMYGRPTAPASGVADPNNRCFGRAQQVQIVDLSNGIQLRGKVRLPMDTWGWYGWGWGGCGVGDWFWGSEVAQVEGSALAFRRWAPVFDANGATVDSNSSLWIADLASPDAPTLGSVSIVQDARAWWGNMRVAGNVLYTGHYEWEDSNADGGSGSTVGATVRYYADRIDLSDRAHPRVAAKINVPGLIVGGSTDDPNLLYTIDYRWNGDQTHDDFNVLRVNGDTAELVSTTTLDGWVGSTFVRGKVAYMSAQQYADPSTGVSDSTVQLHALDLSDPARPVDRASTGSKGWGWLLDVQGDRAIVQSGWQSAGVDIYQLIDGQPPQFRQFTRTLGWSANGVSRQGDTLFLSSGYWGVQKVDLK
jgi:hypothetical protein